MLKIHVLHTMPAEEKQQLKQKLQEEHEGEAAEEAARALLFSAEISRLQGEHEDAKRFGNQALQFLPQLGSRGNANGTAAALHLTLALLGLDGHLSALDKCPRCCRAYDEAIKFKRWGLERRLADAECAIATVSSSSVETGTMERSEEGVDDEEFFSAEEDGDHEGHVSSSSAWKAAFWKWKFRRPPSIETDLGDGVPVEGSPQSSLSWASEVAVKALKDLAKKSAVAGGHLGHQASEQLGHLANSTGLWALGKTGRRPFACGSSKLHLEALLRQADQGDCSVVSMSTPGPGVSEAEVVAYLRWAHWNSLRGMTRHEALRQYGILASWTPPSPGGSKSELVRGQTA